MIALHYLSFSANIPYFLMSKKSSSLQFIITLKLLWTVFDYFNKVAAIPLVAADINNISFESKYVIILFRRKDFPIPPGASKNRK